MTPFAPQGSIIVPMPRVEEELYQQMKKLQGDHDTPVQRAHMSNLVIFCETRERAEELSAQVPQIVVFHAARVLLVVGEPNPSGESDSRTVTASVQVRKLETGAEVSSYSEQVTLHAAGGGLGKLPFAVRGLLIGDLPVNLWWDARQPPALAGPMLYDLAENAQQIIYDSLGWTEPARAVAATFPWLQQVEQGLPGGRWRVASDLNWRRLKFWRRILAQAFDASAAPGAVGSATELLVEHGPHAVIQAWELLSWLTLRIDWKVRVGKVQSGSEIDWQIEAPHGDVRVRLRRLPEGPAEVLLVRLQCHLGDAAGAVLIRRDGPGKLVTEQEGVSASPRGANFQEQPLAELVGRQLSDRERDPVFIESMSIARTFAKSCESA